MRTPWTAVVLSLGTLGCTTKNTDSAVTAIEVGDIVDVFALTDVNPTSPSVGTVVSVDEFEGRVSAWYFAHAT